MIQALGKIPSDGFMAKLLLFGTKEMQQEPGLFDQCLSLKSTIGKIKGKYCSVFISEQPLQPSLEIVDFKSNGLFSSANLKKSQMGLAARPQSIFSVNLADIVIGLCVPSSCSAQDVRNAVSQRIGRSAFQFPSKQRESNGGNKTLFYSYVTKTHDRFCQTKLDISEEHTLHCIHMHFINKIIQRAISFFLFFKLN